MDVQREWFEKNYYETLGVAEDAPAKEITAAYRKLARKLHPDANPDDPTAEERFKEVSAAYEVVGDPDKRSRYDEVRRMGPMAGAGGMGGGFSGFPGGGFDAGDLGDLIGNLFSRGRAGRQPSGPRRGMDLEAELQLSFDAAVSGAMTTVQVHSDVRCPDCSGTGAAKGTSPRTCSVCNGRGAVQEDQGVFSFSRPCTACGGQGRVIETPCGTCRGSGSIHRPREIKVKIPAGVRDGQRIRVKGRGAAGANGGPPGDLYVQVRVQSHPVFGRRGDHLTVSVPITLAEAGLGADVAVPTLDGETVTIRVPAGTGSGRTFRVRGKGVTTARSTGDLLVTVELDVPVDLNDDQRRALEAFGAATPSPRAHPEHAG